MSAIGEKSVCCMVEQLITLKYLLVLCVCGKFSCKLQKGRYVPYFHLFLLLQISPKFFNVHMLN